jgi:hypothetical protein
VLTLFLALFLQAPATVNSPMVKADTLGVLRALATHLRRALHAPITVQVDTSSCGRGAPMCPPPSGTTHHPLLEAFLVEFGEGARKWKRGRTECREYRSGPFDILLRPPVFDSSGATVLVSMLCLRPASTGEEFGRGEEFHFRFDGKWHLTARRLVWIT